MVHIGRIELDLDVPGALVQAGDGQASLMGDRPLDNLDQLHAHRAASRLIPGAYASWHNRTYIPW